MRTPSPPQWGSMLFDHFVTQRWDPTSQLSRDEQKAALVAVFISLGKAGIQECYRGWADWIERENERFQTPAIIPRDLLSPYDRMHDCTSTIFWIRTWYGDEEGRREADEAYHRLCEKSFLEEDFGEEMVVRRSHRFEGDEFSYNNAGDLARPWSTPAYIVNAFCHYPNTICFIPRHAAYMDPYFFQGPNSELDFEQKVLVFIADREAHEKGWVLALALNHQGKILPVRVRLKAGYVSQKVFDWFEERPIAEDFEDHEDTLEYIGDGDGWVRDI